MAVPYTKPHLTIEQQVALLEDRGMRLPDRAAAAELLRRVGYYRLSGYWYPFRKMERAADEGAPAIRTSTFVAGASLDVVARIYLFDRALRMLVFEALDVVEVALRSRLGHLLGRSDPFAHRDPRSMNCSDEELTDLLCEIDKQEARSAEDFAVHFRHKYGPSLPVWATTEVITFGTLARVFSAMPEAHRDRVAVALGVIDETRGRGNGALLANWIGHLRYLRNICAHHARLWNRNMTVQLALPENVYGLDGLREKRPRERVYGSLAVLAHLLAHVDPGCSWPGRLRSLVSDTLSEVAAVTPDVMGFPQDWWDEPVWQPDFTPPHGALEAELDQLDALGTLTATEAGARIAPQRSGAHRGSYVRYLRTRGHLIAVQVAGAWEYPAFQFSDGSPGVIPVVAVVNQKLMSRHDPRGALAWWTSPSGKDAHESPLHLLRSGRLQDVDLDRMSPVTTSAEEPPGSEDPAPQPR